MTVCAQSVESCSALCDPVDCSPPGSSVMGFSRQEYWSGLPCPPPEEFPTVVENKLYNYLYENKINDLLCSTEKDLMYLKYIF